MQTEDPGSRRYGARSGRYILGDDGVRTDGCPVPDADPAQDDTTSPKQHSRTDLRGLIKTLRQVVPVITREGDAMVEHTVIADDARLVYHHAVLMHEPDASSQLHLLVDLEAQDIPDISPHGLVKEDRRTSHGPRGTVRLDPRTEAVDRQSLAARVVPRQGCGLSVLL